jgi:hypothetical protein
VLHALPRVEGLRDDFLFLREDGARFGLAVGREAGEEPGRGVVAAL